MEQYTKPFLSIPDQITKIHGRGLIISDHDKATDYLSKIGYYRLSGYWYPLRQSQLVNDENGRPTTKILDDFRAGAEFAQVVDLYAFDKRLRLLMLDVLERIEIALRTDVSLQLGQYDPWAYRDGQYLDRNFVSQVPTGKTDTRFNTFISRFDDMVANSKDDFVEHFRVKYTNPLPIWAAVELWDFGMLSVFFSGFKYRDKRAIAARYGIPRPELLPTWIRTLSYARNVCAHHSRLWNKPLASQPRQPKIGEVPLLDHLYGDHYAQERFYSAAAIARYFQLQINPNSTWGTRFVDLAKTFPLAPGISIGQAGFPNDWEKLPIWC